jgi:thiosulfate reductase cytochrome b subunit
MVGQDAVAIRRHSITVRVTHWINTLCLLILLLSGLQIFNAHPALYWGQVSTFNDPVLALTAAEDDARGIVGITTILGHSFNTTGILGASSGYDGAIHARGFPSWLTLPSYQDLATGRRWHFFFAWLLVANGTVYLLHGLLSGHLRRDLLPTGEQIKHIGRSIREHLLLRFPAGDEARRYNVLQKLAYLFVALVLLPLMVLTGLTMSPGIDAAFPELLTLFGGRQSARTIHFVAATGLVLFVVIHIAMVLLSGAWNNLRSMVTGAYVLPGGRLAHRS